MSIGLTDSPNYARMVVLTYSVGMKTEVTNVYAIIETGSKQYRVQPGDTIDIELLDLAEGQEQVSSTASCW